MTSITSALTLPPRAAQLIGALHLAPHPEGGFYAEVFRSSLRVLPDDGRGERTALTTIYFLLVAGQASRWHRVRADEVWHFYEGDGLELLTAAPGAGTCVRHVLGPVEGTIRPTHTVPAGHWQAARPLGRYTLAGCSVGPGFEFEDFAMLSDSPESARDCFGDDPELRALL